jgi:hypothetical protein
VLLFSILSKFEAALEKEKPKEVAEEVFHKMRRTLLEHLFANSVFAFILALFVVIILLVLAVFVVGTEVLRIASFIVVWFSTVFLLTLLMVAKRLYVLFEASGFKVKRS